MSSFDRSPSLSLGISGGSMVTSLQTSLRIYASVSLTLLCLRTENPPFMQDTAWSTLLLFPQAQHFGIPRTAHPCHVSGREHPGTPSCSKPGLAIGRVVSHDEAPFSDWCCRMEVKAEFLLSAACRNVEPAFFLFDTSDFAAFSCTWMLVEGSAWSNVSSCFITNLRRGSVAVVEYSYSFKKLSLLKRN